MNHKKWHSIGRVAKCIGVCGGKKIEMNLNIRVWNKRIVQNRVYQHQKHQEVSHKVICNQYKYLIKATMIAIA